MRPNSPAAGHAAGDDSDRACGDALPNTTIPADDQHPSDALVTAARVFEAWTVIQATCPEVFNLEAPVPLAIGIRQELAELGAPLSEPELARLCRWWCSRENYLEALERGGCRQHLDGSVADEVLPEHRDFAAERRRKRKGAVRLMTEAEP